MNKKTKIIYLIAVPVFALIAFCVMFFVFDWSLKKSIIICGGSAVAMMITDFFAMYFAEKKSKNSNQESTDSTDLNTLL
jgi:flagellar basal body-associated protein FliL